MKKPFIAYLLCCILLLLCGCNTKPTKYKRISFNNETLGETLNSVNENTAVINKANKSFQAQMPIYEIRKCGISEQKFHQMEEQLGITKWYWNDFDGYEIHSLIAPYNDPARGYFYTLNMTDDELEELAWETFNKIPFIDGEYEYLGITSTYTLWNSKEGERITAVTVSFRRLIDGIRVIGNDVCDLTFDGSGLQEMHIALYNYKKIGTMDVVPMADAVTKIKTPDSFSIDKETDIVKTMQVDRVKLLLVNQYSRGCTILQPLYNFIGTATLEDESQTGFSSKVIAIPESMTYEEE